LSRGLRKKGARTIFAKFLRATTRVAPTFPAEQAQPVGATLVALIPTNRKRREKGVAKVKKKEDTP